ncbi:ubiquitin 3 binding protein But2 C-terminal domain-containing protein [Lineolata rhizophorae]|uniref:Ubiquitin 3 binding protein But2 C-terminal domain-containing protein n=1 Tax=Lineolata rhizophorae TaxID=578093 RepID=A0A6A6NZ08_9PEZI|nr:ubiquitin 3 binding protein But2 C-terminal domain-containing protein [Lineolata rhizophorae]
MKVASTLAATIFTSAVVGSPVSSLAPRHWGSWGGFWGGWHGWHGSHGGHEGELSCPANGTLAPGAIEPSLMVVISASEPDTAFGGTQWPEITPDDKCTIFNLDLPGDAGNSTCTLKFLFPDHTQTSAPYYIDGGMHFTFNGYAPGVGADTSTTYAMQPEDGPNPPTPPALLEPGNAYIINAGPCLVPEGVEKFTVSGALCSSDSTFKYLQTSGMKCPIGFYVEIS